MTNDGEFLTSAPRDRLPMGPRSPRLRFVEEKKKKANGKAKGRLLCGSVLIVHRLADQKTNGVRWLDSGELAY